MVIQCVCLPLGQSPDPDWGQPVVAYDAVSEEDVLFLDPAAHVVDDERDLLRGQPVSNVSAARFAELMQQVQAWHGRPLKVDDLSVFSTDADVLNCRSKEELGHVCSLFAIGAMPESGPADSRRASVRGQIRTALSADQLAAAKQMEMTVEDLQKDAEFARYFTIKNHPR